MLLQQALAQSLHRSGSRAPEGPCSRLAKVAAQHWKVHGTAPELLGTPRLSYSQTVPGLFSAAAISARQRPVMSSPGSHHLASEAPVKILLFLEVARRPESRPVNGSQGCSMVQSPRAVLFAFSCLCHGPVWEQSSSCAPIIRGRQLRRWHWRNLLLEHAARSGLRQRLSLARE